MINQNIALVMEGGAMRGMFTAGVIDVFMENGIDFPAAVGVSAGAVFGCNIKSRQKGRVIRYNTRFCGDKRYCSLSSLIKTGDLYGAEFCYHTLPEKLDPFDFDEYDKNPMAFYVVCTDILTGKPVYKRLDKADDECFLWMRASASMPLVSKPVNVGGYTLLDGGISDAVPLRFMQEQGYKRNVVILTQHREYVKKPSSKLIFGLGLRHYPALRQAMERRHAMYRYERDYVFDSEKRGESFVICPDSELDISRTESNPEKLRSVYRIGRETALKNLEKLKAFLQD